MDKHNWDDVIKADLDKKVEPQLCTRCLVCGENVAITGFNDYPKICNSCKKGILFSKELSSLGISPNDIAEAVSLIRSKND